MPNGYPGDTLDRRPSPAPDRPSNPRPRPPTPRPDLPTSSDIGRSGARIMRGTGARATARFALRGAGRLIPGVGIALIIYDLTQLLIGPNPQPPGYDMRGWNLQWGPYTYTGQNANPTKGSGFRPYIDRRMPPDGNGPLARQAYQPFMAITPGTTGVSLTELYDYTALQADKLRYISGWYRGTGTTIDDPIVDLPTMPSTHPLPGTPRVRGGTIVSPTNPVPFPRWVDPLSYPPGAPVPADTNPPWELIPERVPNPFRSPHEQTIIGPITAPGGIGLAPPTVAPVPPTIVIGPAPVVITPGVPAPGIGTPVTTPGTTTPDLVVSPDPGTIVDPAPVSPGGTAPAPRTPPKKNEKEKKTRIRRNGVIQGIAKVAGVATETLDFINVMYDALPKSCKPGYYLLTGKGGVKFYKRRWRANQSQRVKAIAACYEKSDITKLVTGFIGNHFEDKLIGKLGQKAKEAHAASGSLRPLGLQSGPWDTLSSKAWSEYQRREEDRKEREREAARAEHSRKKAIIRAQRSAANKAEYRKRFTKRPGG